MKAKRSISEFPEAGEGSGATGRLTPEEVAESSSVSGSTLSAKGQEPKHLLLSKVSSEIQANVILGIMDVTGIEAWAEEVCEGNRIEIYVPADQLEVARRLIEE